MCLYVCLCLFLVMYFWLPVGRFARWGQRNVTRLIDQPHLVGLGCPGCQVRAGRIDCMTSCDHYRRHWLVDWPINDCIYMRYHLVIGRGTYRIPPARIGGILNIRAIMHRAGSRWQPHPGIFCICFNSLEAHKDPQQYNNWCIVIK